MEKPLLFSIAVSETKNGQGDAEVLHYVVSQEKKVKALREQVKQLKNWRNDSMKLMSDVLYDLEFESNKKYFYDKAEELLNRPGFTQQDTPTQETE